MGLVSPSLILSLKPYSIFPGSNWNCKKEGGLSFEKYIYTLKPNPNCLSPILTVKPSPTYVTKNSSDSFPLLRHMVEPFKL
jgi:hypothetical protein